MEAKELMIGDWLFYRGQFNAFEFKVVHITKQTVGYHAEPDESRIRYLRLSECEAVPITSEILERNGFGKYNLYNIKEQHQWVLWFDKLTRVSLWYRELNDDNRDGMMVRVESPLANLCIKVCYLHQLQHALKLCGIEKEITIY
ncbi:MAG: hypothetical protein J5953_09895 [Prevotella sp.]|nr:hypothetical protein [Prevotella sp.]